MPAESSPASRAVFLSYASQDAEAARRICEALRADGVDIWFDQEGGLEHGDEWDAKIRRQIKECVLFIPLISANTQARHEGYFRLEWELAAERAMSIASGVPFILPVVIDDTREPEALVPDRFRKVQWTRLPGGVVPPDVHARFLKVWSHRVGLVSHEEKRAATAPGKTASSPAPARSKPYALMAAVAVAVVALAGWWFSRSDAPKSVPVAATPKVAVEVKPTPPPLPTAPAANDKSLVVLPLENLSPDPENAFFTDGMHADIIAAVSRLPDLKVVSRTSALHFKDSKASLPEIARSLGVANVITGSVRRVGNQVRIQLELRRGSDEALLWSPTYNRELKDALGIQSEVAAEVARLLQARQMTGTSASAKLSTTNPQAYDFFLKGLRLFYSSSGFSPTGIDECCDLFSQAVKIDPGFAFAAGYLSAAHTQGYANENDSARRVLHAVEAKRWAEVALGLSSESGAITMAYYLYLIAGDSEQAFEFAQRALLVLPNDAVAHNVMSLVLGSLGRWAEAAEEQKRAIELDPYNLTSFRNLAGRLVRLRRSVEWEALCSQAVAAGVGGVGDFGMATQRFRLRGEMPADLAAISGTARLPWLALARRWEEFVQAIDAALADPALHDLTRCDLLCNQALALRQLGRTPEANRVGAAALAVTEKFAPGDPDQYRTLVIRARDAVGQTDEAIAAARKYVNEVAAGKRLSERWARELLLARLCARAGRTRESVALVKHLIEVPSQLTVPMLRTESDWDKIRDDPEFKALLADPKNSAPL
jgi:TolB-like protein